MFNSNFKQFIRSAKGINLSEKEKSAAKQSVLNFIKNNPVRNEIQPRLTYGSNIFLTNLNFASTMAVLLIITMFVGGGVAFGAEKALPGDTLYPVKVGFNEEVRSWLSVSDEAKANWEVTRAQRRLEEAEELANNGSLSVEVRENLEANFEAHAERVKERIDKFEGKENFKAAVDVSSKFETSLRAHQKILKRLTVESEDDVKKEVKPIEARVRSKANVLIRARKQMELKANASANVEAGSAPKNEEQDENDLEIEDDTDLDLNLNSGGGTIRSQGRLKANLGL